jgi:hypothetical protein
MYIIYSGAKIKKNGMGGALALAEERKGAYSVLVGKSEGKSIFGRPRRRWEDNIKMVLRDVRWGRDWIDMTYYRDMWQAVVNAAAKFRVT